MTAALIDGKFRRVPALRQLMHHELERLRPRRYPVCNPPHIRCGLPCYRHVPDRQRGLQLHHRQIAQRHAQLHRFTGPNTLADAPAVSDIRGSWNTEISSNQAEP